MQEVIEKAKKIKLMVFDVDGRSAYQRAALFHRRWHRTESL